MNCWRAECDNYCNETCAYIDFFVFRTQYECTDTRSEAWRWFSYTFSHSSWTHLLSNLFVFVALGLMLDVANREIDFLMIYVFSAVGGALLHGAMWTSGLVGSSGAVYGILGARLANIILNSENMGLFELLCRISVVVALGTITIVTYAVYKNENTSHSCHAGGAVVGFVSALWFLRNLETRKCETYLRFALTLVFAALFSWYFLIYITKEVC